MWIISTHLALSTSQTPGSLSIINSDFILRSPRIYPGVLWQCLRQGIYNSIFISAILTNTHVELTMSPVNYKCFTNSNSFNPHDNPTRYLVTLSACYKWRNWGPKKISNFTGVIQPIHGWTTIWLPEAKLKNITPVSFLLAKWKSLNQQPFFNLVVKSIAQPWLVGSVDWVSDCERKGCWFDS